MCKENHIPIIAFCTDIEESVTGIEKRGQQAFKQYCNYLKSVAEVFIPKLILANNKTEKNKYINRYIWMPGDALWGIAATNKTIPFYIAILDSFARIIVSIAYGLTQTNLNLLDTTSSPITIRASSFVGEIFEEKLLNNTISLFNGRSLNACGRMQQYAEPNSLFIGFISKKNNLYSRVNDEDELFNLGLPEINFNDLRKNINNNIKNINNNINLGCNISFDIVIDENDNNYLKFMTFPTRTLKGLTDTLILTSKVKFSINRINSGFNIESNPCGSYYRKEYSVNISDNQFSLYDLIALDKNLKYLAEIYTRKEDLIFFYNKDTKSFIINFYGNNHRPRYKETKIKKVDFLKHKYCLLPIYDTHIGRNKDIVLVIQPDNHNKTIALVFKEIQYNELNEIEDYKYYFNQSNTTIKFVFNNKKWE